MGEQLQQIGQGLARAWEKPNRDPTHEWAARNVELFRPITKPGKFDCSESRHFIPIFDALDDGRTREVNILKPVRGGGSLIGDIHLIESLARSVGSYLNVFQTDDEAKMFWFDRIEKMLR